MAEHDTQHMINHWWWRPGWSLGRRFYTWHLTFAEKLDVHRLASIYRDALSALPGLVLVPDEWLHLTMQGVGFLDEVPQASVEAIKTAAYERLADVAPFDLVFGRARVGPEGVYWALDSDGPAAVRTAIRAAIGDVLDEVPEPENGFMAHVSIAYSSSSGPMAPVRAAVTTVNAPAAIARITAAQLIVLHRDNRMYEWTTSASVPLGG